MQPQSELFAFPLLSHTTGNFHSLLSFLMSLYPTTAALQLCELFHISVTQEDSRPVTARGPQICPVVPYIVCISVQVLQRGISKCIPNKRTRFSPIMLFCRHFIIYAYRPGDGPLLSFCYFPGSFCPISHCTICLPVQSITFAPDCGLSCPSCSIPCLEISSPRLARFFAKMLLPYLFMWIPPLPDSPWSSKRVPQW